MKKSRKIHGKIMRKSWKNLGKLSENNEKITKNLLPSERFPPGTFYRRSFFPRNILPP